MKMALSLVITLILFMLVAPLYEMLKANAYKKEKDKLSPGGCFMSWEMESFKWFKVCDIELTRVRTKAFLNVYPNPFKEYFRLFFRNLNWVLKKCKFLLLLVLKERKNQKQKKEVSAERNYLEGVIKETVFDIWGDSLAYNVDAWKYPKVEWRDGREEVGEDCDIYALEIFGEVHSSIMTNFQNRFSSEVNEPITKVGVVEVPNDKSTKKELIFLVARRKNADRLVKKYFYDKQVKTV